MPIESRFYLQAEIDELSRPGFRMGGGGVLHLPKGVTQIDRTIRVGAPDSPATLRPSVTLRGHGQGGQMMPSGRPWGGTILEWVGLPGGTMMEVCGPYFRIEDVHFHMGTASTGLRLTSNNAKGATTQNPTVRASFAGALQPNDSVAVHITGERWNDQTDRVDLQLDVMRCGWGVRQDSQQSALSLVRQSSLSTWRGGIEVTNGSLMCHASCFNDRQEIRDESYRAIRVGAIPETFYAGHQVHVSDCHFETSRGGVMDIDAPGASFMSNFTENNVSMQRHTPGDLLIARSVAAGPLFCRGNTVGVSGPTREQTPIVEGNVMWWPALNYIRPQVAPDLVRR